MNLRVALLVLALPLAGCQAPGSPAATSPATSSNARSPASPASGGPAEWDRVLAAAKQEGKVAVVINPPVDTYRPLYDAFQKQYNIPVDLLTVGGNSDFLPRVGAERQAGQYLWDAGVHSPTVLGPSRGWLAPLRSALILPEVVDDGKWLGGFDAGWYDRDKARGMAYSFVSYAFRTVYINRDLIPEAQLNTLDQLWDPRWKGKMAMQDPRTPSAGSAVVSAWLASRGEDKVRAFLRDQQPVITQDKRQLGDWIVRGQFPIALGLAEPVIVEFERQGLDIKHVKPLLDPAAGLFTASSGAVGIFDRAPHPNATKLFVNWLLSQEAQVIYTQRSGFNSRRTDVPVVSPNQAIDQATIQKGTVTVETEDSASFTEKAVEIAKELLK